jgi:predicted aspartyl protease
MLLPLLLDPSLDVAHAEDEILLAARINNQPVQFTFDTGAERSVLFRGAAKRLGLRITKVEHRFPLPAGEVAMDVAEECTLTFRTSSGKAQFAVLDDPPYGLADSDGIIAWSSFGNCVIQVNVEQHVCDFLRDLPADLKSWSKWKLVPKSRLLVFECSHGKQSAKIGIDTGSGSGVILNPQRWREWRAKRERQPATIDAYWTPAVGLVVNEVMRAKRIMIGDLTLTDVPVTVDTTPSQGVLFRHSDAVLGVSVLRRLEFIIDGRKGALYTRPITSSSGQYDYNRLGAVFVPKDPDKGDDLVAHVVEGSPAYRAGIRNGDILLQIGAIDATNRRTNPHILPLNRFWSQTAGTKHELTLKRNDQQFETTVTLEELPAAE